MPNNTIKVRRKTQKEVRAYKNFIKQGDMHTMDTVEVSNDNLIGSDQCGSFVLRSTEQPNIPLSFKIKQFVKKHTFEVFISLIVGLILALVAWYGGTLIQMKVDYAVLQTKVEAIEKTLDSLETDTITKDVLDLQLNALKQELENSTDLSIIEINARIDLIEEQIEHIRDANRVAD